MQDRSHSLLNLLQLASPALPVGAYCYSDGLENLVERNIINSKQSLEKWLDNELKYGAIRLETAIMLRAYNCLLNKDILKLKYWNFWLSASKETSELRQQSWQMGNSLLKLILSLEESDIWQNYTEAIAENCNYAIAFGIAAGNWKIDRTEAIIAYLHSWLTNIINAGVKLIPLGQTSGQQLLFKLRNRLVLTAETILILEDDDLISCSWGLALASMAHETQYSRLFRS
jgi:urease accessory protein